MNFIYKIKNFQRVMEEKNKLKTEFENYKKRTDEQLSNLSEERFEQLKEISNLKESLASSVSDKKKLKEISGAKGGLKKQNNKLLKKINSLEAKIKIQDKQLSEYKDKKWLVRELTPEKARSQKIKPVKPMKSSVIKYMAEKHNY